jgi:hypothetical protein
MFKLAFDGPAAVEALARLGFGHRHQLQRLLKLLASPQVRSLLAAA